MRRPKMRSAHEIKINDHEDKDNFRLIQSKLNGRLLVFSVWRRPTNGMSIFFWLVIRNIFFWPISSENNDKFCFECGSLQWGRTENNRHERCREISILSSNCIANRSPQRQQQRRRRNNANQHLLFCHAFVECRLSMILWRKVETNK